MALKETFQKWQEGVTAFNEGEYQRCVETLTSVTEPSSWLLYNTACAQLKLGQTEKATQTLSYAVSRDSNFALGYFQRGVLHLKAKRENDAETDFQTTVYLMRGNHLINYRPLGLTVKLYHCEVLYNLAVTKLKQGHVTSAKKFLQTAKHYQQELIHEKYLQTAVDLIEERRYSDVKPFEISVNSVFKPPKTVTENLEKREYMSKAKVVAARDARDQQVGFNGPQRVEELKTGAPFVSSSNPVTALKRLLLKPNKAPPSLPIRNSKSMTDLREVEKKSEFSVTDDVTTCVLRSVALPKDISPSSQNKFKYKNTSPQDSVGSLFGNSLGVVGHTLSNSCNVLTAVVASPVTVLVDDYSGEDRVSDTARTAGADTAKMDTSRDTATDTAIQIRHKKSDTPAKPFVNFNIGDRNKLNVSRDLCNSLESVEDNLKSDHDDDDDDSIYVNIPKPANKRPPPPSYAPPPLPSLK